MQTHLTKTNDGNILFIEPGFPIKSASDRQQMIQDLSKIDIPDRSGIVIKGKSHIWSNAVIVSWAMVNDFVWGAIWDHSIKQMIIFKGNSEYNYLPGESVDCDWIPFPSSRSNSNSESNGS